MDNSMCVFSLFINRKVTPTVQSMQHVALKKSSSDADRMQSIGFATIEATPLVLSVA